MFLAYIILKHSQNKKKMHQRKEYHQTNWFYSGIITCSCWLYWKNGPLRLLEQSWDAEYSKSETCQKSISFSDQIFQDSPNLMLEQSFKINLPLGGCSSLFWWK